LRTPDVAFGFSDGSSFAVRAERAGGCTNKPRMISWYLVGASREDISALPLIFAQM
jgi:hypothetical protein